MNNKNAKRTVFLIAGATDMLLGALGLLAYFGLIPLDLDGLGIPHWVAGLVGAALFFPGLAVFIYNLSAPE